MFLLRGHRLLLGEKENNYRKQTHGTINIYLNKKKDTLNKIWRQKFRPPKMSLQKLRSQNAE